MSTVRLRPCPTCGRHARVSEGGCPFCGQHFDDAFREVPAPQPPARRLSRAALFALGSGAVLAPACTSSPASPHSAGGGTTVAPPYGGFPTEDASLGAAYGLAPFIDAGEIDGAEIDAGDCVLAGGQCGSTCAFSISASCGAAGGSCCVPCQADPDVHAISASNYDRSCTLDSDCVAVGVGDPCRPCDILCAGNAAINKSSMSQYSKDVADSPALGDSAACSCAPTTLSVCCNAGTCDPSCGVDGSTGPVQGVDAGPGDSGVEPADGATD
jgi:hypothetical protein